MSFPFIFLSTEPTELTDNLHFPSGKGRFQHGHVRFAAGGGKSRCDELFHALRAGHRHDEHVLRQPAFVVADAARDAQREALLPEQRVASVAAAEARDFVVGRDVGDDRLLRITRPVIHQLA